jgi:glycosyltransferase involved in cell wall biosynthesis
MLLSHQECSMPLSRQPGIFMIKLRIALITETYTPEINGVAVTLHHLVTGMLRRGHSFHVIRPRQFRGDAPKSAADYRETLVPGIAIPRYDALKLGLPAGRRLRELWHRDPPDIVHVTTEGPLGASAVKAALAAGIPVSTDFHTNFHAYAEHYGIRWLERPVLRYLRWLHNKALCTMVPTHELKRQLAGYGFQNLMVVARGVDTQLFHPARRDAGLRRCWGAAPDDPVVLFVSRMAPEINLPLLMQTYAAMHRVDPRSRLIVVGDGPARPRLQARHPEAVYTGMRTGEELAAHYASADIFIYPSITETYGNVTLEAMASGLAVVSYDYAAAAVHIRSGKNGLTAPLSDARQFMQRAVQLMHNRARIAEFGHNARMTAETIDWADVVCDFESALAEIVHGRPLAARAA